MFKKRKLKQNGRKSKGRKRKRFENRIIVIVIAHLLQSSYFSNAAGSRLSTNLKPEVRNKMYCFLHPEDFNSNVGDTNKEEEEDDEEKEEGKDNKEEQDEEEEEHSHDEIEENVENEEGDTLYSERKALVTRKFQFRTHISFNMRLKTTFYFLLFLLTCFTFVFFPPKMFSPQSLSSLRHSVMVVLAIVVVSRTWILKSRYNHSLSLDATIMVSKYCPAIGEHIVIIFATQ